ncbi:succinyl-CoA ligase subunit alpha [Mycena metata]|uniref:Succinyl-CoA ligase subunit alpha n=1 Tax=Mycena metata TaxID=1033252 RepID=A0AAD7J0R9_9AGAR|nr:succinyl-CoA ligase subunit alpha [Mycena metata]
MQTALELPQSRNRMVSMLTGCSRPLRLRTRILGVASFSTSSSRHSYKDTIKNLKVGADTRVIFQGFTGRQATANAQESLAWGTQIVGGVTPGREGTHPILRELPVLPTVKAAMEVLKPDATGIYVAAHQAAAAIEEAIEAEVPLIVAVAEHIPVHDMLKIHSMLKSQSKSRLVGANAPGIISAIGRCRIGFQPLPVFSPGHVGIVAKSGTLSYETVASLTRAGVGQSLCIGMGGDMVAGTDFVDALNVFEHDPDTHGIIIVGEVGGQAEEEAAAWIENYRIRTPQPKPIAALVAGKLIKPGYVMGHSGAWAGWGENSAEQKHQILERAGAVMVDHPSQFGEVMQQLLFKPDKSLTLVSGHRHVQLSQTITSDRPLPSGNLHELERAQGPGDVGDFLVSQGILLDDFGPWAESTDGIGAPRKIALAIDRSKRTPHFRICQSTDDNPKVARAKYIPFDFRSGPTASGIAEALEHLDIKQLPSLVATRNLLLSLFYLFKKYEAIILEVRIAVEEKIPDLDPEENFKNDLIIYDPQFVFDPAAFKSGNRHPEIHVPEAKAQGSVPLPEVEVAAKEDGIVYVKLGPSDSSDPEFSSYNIGTLVNGAGLAMNTVDALALAPHHGRAANFLDTGGKATAETVKKSFALLLADPRVKVIFVNIFGGLTLGDMIARGILLAFRELGLEERGMPVVVRIRGTNEAEGQRILADSGLKIFAFDGFDEAAAKCVELARSNS